MIYFDLLQAITFALVGLLLFEDMPWTLLGSCIASNVAYYFVLQTFPFIQLTSPAFIISLGKFSTLDVIVTKCQGSNCREPSDPGQDEFFVGCLKCCLELAVQYGA